MERSFAVVQWIEGEDSGKFSDVKTDAIRNYDDSKMDQDGSPISSPYSAFIEWRHGKRRKGGWPHYKGDVLFVSGKFVLNTTHFKGIGLLASNHKQYYFFCMNYNWHRLR